MQELIYNQTRVPKKKWRYGLRSTAAVGCGWVALYNALCILGRSPVPEDLIRRLERQIPVIHGNAGTFAAAPGLTLRSMGYTVRFCADRRKFDSLAREADVCILFYYWKSRWKLGSHFVALRYVQDRFEGYNTYRTSDGPDIYGPSLEAFLKQSGYFGCVLAAVSKA